MKRSTHTPAEPVIIVRHHFPEARDPEALEPIYRLWASGLVHQFRRKRGTFPERQVVGASSPQE